MTSNKYRGSSLYQLVASDLTLLVFAIILLILSGIYYILLLIFGVLYLIGALIIGSPLYFLFDSGSTIRIIYEVAVVGFFIIGSYTVLAFVMYVALFNTPSPDEDSEPGTFAYDGTIGSSVSSILWWLGFPAGGFAVSLLWLTGNISLPDRATFWFFLLFFGLVFLIRFRGLVISLHGTTPILSTFIICYLITGGSIEAFSFIVGPDFTEILFDDQELGMFTVYYPIFIVLELLAALPFLSISDDLFVQLLLFDVESGHGFFSSLSLVFIIIPLTIYTISLSVRFWVNIVNTVGRGYNYLNKGINDAIIPVVVGVGYFFWAFILKFWGLFGYTLLLKPRDER